MILFFTQKSSIFFIFFGLPTGEPDIDRLPVIRLNTDDFIGSTPTGEAPEAAAIESWIYKNSDYTLAGSSLDLKPQLEEGVTNVKWLTKDQSIDCAKKSFKSIRIVWEAFLANL